MVCKTIRVSCLTHCDGCVYEKGIDMQTVAIKGRRPLWLITPPAPTDVVSLEDADFIAEKYDKPWLGSKLILKTRFLFSHRVQEHRKGRHSRAQNRRIQEGVQRASASTVTILN